MDKPVSNQPNLQVLARLRAIQTLAVSVVYLVAGGVLALWIIQGSPMSDPVGWSRMTAMTAFSLLLAATSFGFSCENDVRSITRIGTALGAVVLMIGIGSFVACATGSTPHLDIRFDVWSHYVAQSCFPERPSTQTSIALVVIGASLLLAKRKDGVLSWTADALILLLLILIFAAVGGYLNSAMGLAGIDTATLVAPHTLFCLFALTFCLIVRRTENNGFFTVLIGRGKGSQLARILFPVVIIVTFVSSFLLLYLINLNLVNPAHAIALATAIRAYAVLCIVLWLARRINILESKLFSMSVTDELTRIYNRRGFNLLGEQAIKEAKRERIATTVLFFDLDGLKEINDTYGHETGSQFIVDVAQLLTRNFRDADIIARVGGDEFAVIMRTHNPDAALARLDSDVAAFNRTQVKGYTVRYSVGTATFDPMSEESFSSMVQRADLSMYKQKLAKRSE